MIIGDPIIVCGGDGIPCTLTITTTPGVTVTAVFGTTTIEATADDSGAVVLVLEKEGVWTVTATDGNTSKSIEVDTAYSINETIELG